MTNWLLLTILAFALERAIPVSGRHRHGQSAECTKCSPGESLSKRCNRHHDSECAPCPLGTYQPHHSYKRYCYLCSKCGDGLYIAHACTSVSDTVCDSCHTFKGPHNADYQQKCQIEDAGGVWKMTPYSLGTTQTSKNRRTNAVVSLKDPPGAEAKRKSLLMFLAAGLAILICFVVIFLLSNRCCKTDKKTVRPNYRYQVVKTREPIML